MITPEIRFLIKYDLGARRYANPSHIYLIHFMYR